MAAHAIPVHRCAELIESMTSAAPLPRFVHARIARVAACGRWSQQADLGAALLAYVVCVDEIAIRVGRARGPAKAVPAGGLQEAADLLLPG
jgi:hypothetical protein